MAEKTCLRRAVSEESLRTIKPELHSNVAGEKHHTELEAVEKSC